MKLGFAVKVMGSGGMQSHDNRRWRNNPHLSVSISFLREILLYLYRNDIRMYRMSSDFIPYGTHPDMPRFHNQIAECAAQLAELGSVAGEYGIRLSLHPSQFVVLNAEDESVAVKAVADLDQQSELLDAMGLGDEAVVVTHVGGVYGNKRDGIERFIRRWSLLSDAAKRRVVVENDERLYSVADTLLVHRGTGSRLVFDYLHHVLNHGGLTISEAMAACLDTWPEGQTPKMHYSSPRTELRTLERKNALGKKVSLPAPPLLSQHSDYINPFEFRMFLEKAPDRQFDVMLEAKAKDLALIELRKHLAENHNPL